MASIDEIQARRRAEKLAKEQVISLIMPDTVGDQPVDRRFFYLEKWNHRIITAVIVFRMR
jgi:hypothetical protein